MSCSRPNGWPRPEPSPPESRTRSTTRWLRFPRWCNRCCGGEGDAARRTTLHTILSQITRISVTLKDLVNFARPSPAERRPMNLNDMVTETLRLLAYNKRFAGIALEPRLAPDLNPVFADNNEIQQVLLNLLLNAADATQPATGGSGS